MNEREMTGWCVLAASLIVGTKFAIDGKTVLACVFLTLAVAVGALRYFRWRLER
ncbi:MAG TPA: hypothetical protein VHN11_00345 [Xanthobacteraceae bacterium]|jgi:hypothetical protein|nr:hypothetical protein [Xanthobacteraceae bacterium]